MKNFICLFAVLILASGCRPKSSDAGGDIEVINIPEETTGSILDIAENYRYITLDVGDNTDAMLGAITKLRVFGDKIYVMDNIFTEKMLIFDKDGTFLKKVGFRGRGPREYVDLTTFELNYTEEELLIKDDNGKKILVFDLDGNYKRTVSDQNIRGDGVAVLPGGNIVYGIDAACSNAGELNDFKLIICDSANKPLEWYCKDIVDYKFGYTSLNFINPDFDGTITFAPQLMNDVYLISDAGAKKIYSINFPDMLDRNDYERYDHPSSFNKSSSADKTIFVGNHAGSNDYLCFEYLYEDEDRHAYYNKKDKSVIVCSDNLCARDLTFDRQGNLWGGISAADIFSDESAKAREIADAIVKSGNPVVVCYNLK